MSEIGTVELVFLPLLLFIIVFGFLAMKIKTPYPIVMVVGGLLLSLIPGVPGIVLNPDLIFLVVLPPLLFSAAWNTSWRDLRYNLVSVLLLAFGLVGFTVWGVAVTAPGVFSGFDWRLGMVLGAIVAPTDAIAATSIARQVGLPSRIVDILEGESLINDATGLLALEFATTIVVSKKIPGVAAGFGELVWLVAGGVALGLVAGWLVDRIERWVDDGPIEITISILVPYAVYLAGNAVHASGVLAVIACGLFLTRRSVHFFSPNVRLQIGAVWESLTYVLNGLVFVIIGLQLPGIRASLHGYSLPTLLMDGAIFSAVLILLRYIWVFPGAYLSFFIRTHLLHQVGPKPSTKQVFIVAWTGMRGVVSLAAALALPTAMDDGSPFPQRSLIVFLTFCVIVVTLVLQGLALPSLVRVLGLVGANGPNCEEREARRIIAETVLSHLESAQGRDSHEFAEFYEDLSGHYRQRLVTLNSNGGAESVDVSNRFIELSLEALRVERRTVIQLRNDGRINDEVLRRIERELDLNESGFATVGD